MEAMEPIVDNNADIKHDQLTALTLKYFGRQNIAKTVKKLREFWIKYDETELWELLKKLNKDTKFKQYFTNLIKRNEQNLYKIKSPYLWLSLSEPVLNLGLSILSVWLTYDLSLRTLESTWVDINYIQYSWIEQLDYIISYIQWVWIEPLAISATLSASIAHFRYWIAKHIRNGNWILQSALKLLKEWKKLDKFIIFLAAWWIAADVAWWWSFLWWNFQRSQQIWENINKSNQKIMPISNLLKQIRSNHEIFWESICAKSTQEKNWTWWTWSKSGTLNTNWFTHYWAVTDAIWAIWSCYNLWTDKNTTINYSNLDFPSAQKRVQQKLIAAMKSFEKTHWNIDVTNVLNERLTNLENKIKKIIQEIKILQQSLSSYDNIETTKEILDKINENIALITLEFKNYIKWSTVIYNWTDQFINKAAKTWSIAYWKYWNIKEFQSTNLPNIDIDDSKLKITAVQAMTPIEVWNHFDNSIDTKIVWTMISVIIWIMTNFSWLLTIRKLRNRERKDKEKIDFSCQQELIDNLINEIIDQLTEMINNPINNIYILPHGIKVSRSMVKKAAFQCLNHFQSSKSWTIAYSKTANSWNQTIDYVSWKGFSEDLMKKLLPWTFYYDKENPNAYKQMQSLNHMALELLWLKTPSMKLSASIPSEWNYMIQISEIENVDNISFKINKNNEKTYPVSSNTFPATWKLEYWDNKIVVKWLNNESGSTSEFIIKCRSDHMWDINKLSETQLLNRLSVNHGTMATSVKNQIILAKKYLKIWCLEKVMRIKWLDNWVYEIISAWLSMNELIQLLSDSCNIDFINKKIWERRWEILQTWIQGMVKLANSKDVSKENSEYAMLLIDKIDANENSFVEAFEIMDNCNYLHSELIKKLLNKLFAKANLDCLVIVDLISKYRPISNTGAYHQTFSELMYDSLNNNIQGLFLWWDNHNLNKLAWILISINNYNRENSKSHFISIFTLLYQPIRKELITNWSINLHFDILCSNEENLMDLFQDFSNKFNPKDMVKTLRTICNSKPANYISMAFKAAFLWINDESNPISEESLSNIQWYCETLRVSDENISYWVNKICEFKQKPETVDEKRENLTFSL